MLAMECLPRPLILATCLVLAACSPGPAGPAGSASDGGATAASSPTAGTAVVTPTAPSSLVIEDAGVEVELAPGTYSSRLFRPELSMELGTGWYRKNPNTDRTLHLRYLPGEAGDITISSGIDFIQCGTNPVVKGPSAEAIVEALTTTDSLSATTLDPVAIGGRTGTVIRVAGGGESVADRPPEEWLQFGCVLSQGADPFPAEVLWIPVLSDASQQLVVVDVDGTVVIVRARPTNDAEAIYKAVLDVVRTMSLG